MKPLASISEVARTLQQGATAATALLKKSIVANSPIGQVLAAIDAPSLDQKRYRTKPDREDPRAEQNEVIGWQLTISEIQADINHYIATLRTTADTPSAYVQSRLEALDHSINVNWQENRSDDELRAQNDFIREELKTVVKRFRELGSGKEHNQERAELNLRAINAYKYLMKSQIRLAKSNVTKSSNRIFSSMTALRCLDNASKVGDLLIRELNWRKNRVDATSKIREIATIDFLGQTIWNTSLANLDISVTGGVTTIRQQVWIKPYARLAAINRDFKQGKLEDAREKLQELIPLYPLGTEVGGPLEALDLYIASRAKSPEPAEIEEFTRQVTAIQAMIPERRSFPIHKDIHFAKDAQAGLRSRVHVLEGNYEDYVTIAKTSAHLEDLVLLLEMAAGRGSLSKVNKTMLTEELAMLLDWTRAGNVYPKQFAAKYLNGIIAIVELGYQAQKEDSVEAAKQYQIAAKQLLDATTALKARLQDISRISAGTKRKLNALYEDIRDVDLQGRAGSISEMFAQSKYKEALEQVVAMQALIPRQDLAPGYKRVLKTLTELKAGLENPTKIAPEYIRYLTDLITLDIEKKNQLRLVVVDFDAAVPQKKYVFPNQGISEKGLASWLRKTFLAAGHGWKPAQQLETRSLKDDPSRMFLVCNQRPTKIVMPQNRIIIPD